MLPPLTHTAPAAAPEDCTEMLMNMAGFGKRHIGV
jgi:hypothetical protein